MDISPILNVIIATILICALYFLFAWLFKKIMKPHMVQVNSKRLGASNGYIATSKGSDGSFAQIIDMSIPANREVGEISRINANLKMTIKNLLLIDNSGSITGSLDEIKESINIFIDSRQSNEQIAIYSFSESLYRLCDFDDRASVLKDAVNQMQPIGVTSMNDALIDVANMIENIKDFYKENESTIYNIILFTDGQDNSSRAGFNELIEKLQDKSVFVVCSGDVNINLMIEIAKNPHNVYYIDSLGSQNSTTLNTTTTNTNSTGASTTPSNINNTIPTPIPASNAPGNTNGINTNFSQIRDAFLDIRIQVKGRGSLAYIKLRSNEDPDRMEIRGFVNSRGEIFSTGINGEGSKFLGLCDAPIGLTSRVYIGKCIYINDGTEDYNIVYNGKFGSEIFDVSPLCSAAGAFVVYDAYKAFKAEERKESILQNFGKTALFSALVWMPLFLIYWGLKTFIDGFGAIKFLGQDFDTLLSLIMLYFAIWFIVNDLWTNKWRSKKKYSNFIEGINELKGLKLYNSILIVIAIISIILSITITTNAYVAFCTVVLIAISANLSLSFGAKSKWIVIGHSNLKPPPYTGDGADREISFSFFTCSEELIEDTIKLKVNLNDTNNDLKNKTISDFINDDRSKKYLKYISECLIFLSIEKNLTPIDEFMMFCGFCHKTTNEKEKTDPVMSDDEKMSPAGIIYNDRQVGPTNKLILVSSILKEQSIPFLYYIDKENNAQNLIAIKSQIVEKDSPWVQSIKNESYFIFHYDLEKCYYYPLDKSTSNRSIDSINWSLI